MNTTKHEKTIKELFIGECWEWLRVNFPRFNDTNKIKIALELCKKDTPQEHSGTLTANVVAMGTITKTVGAQIETMKFDIGNAFSEKDDDPQPPPDS